MQPTRKVTAFAHQEGRIQPPVPAGVWDGYSVLSYPVVNWVGEGPAWHSQLNCLFWIDVRAQQLLKLNAVDATIEHWQLPEVVGALALCEGQRVCLALRNRLVMLDLATGRISEFAVVQGEPASNRLNDGKVSPTGRWFVFGSMDDRQDKHPTGALYCASANGQLRRLLQGLTVCNGIAWSPDASLLYFSDSALGIVYRASWDESSGEIGAPEWFATLNEEQGRPDGATVDRAGNYWSAGVSAGCLNVLDPSGHLARKITLPCRAPTMCAFGGPLGNELFVTSLVRPQWEAAGPHDGALLKITLPFEGPMAVLFGSTSACLQPQLSGASLTATMSPG